MLYFVVVGLSSKPQFATVRDLCPPLQHRHNVSQLTGHQQPDSAADCKDLMEDKMTYLATWLWWQIRVFVSYNGANHLDRVYLSVCLPIYLTIYLIQANPIQYSNTVI